MRLIDADALIPLVRMREANDYDEFCQGNNAGIAFAVERIKQMPTIEPERKTGKWIYGESEIGNDGYYCSVCGNFVPWKYDEYDIDFIKEFLFCPNCGCRMEEGEQK